MADVVNPRMITLAREARGFTQQVLAERINMQKSYVSKLENGDIIISDFMLRCISEATAYPLNFFYQPGEVAPVNLSYRMRKKVPAKLLTPIEAKINIVKNNIQSLTQMLEKASPLIPTYQLSEDNSPQQIARQVRAAFGMGYGVINDLTAIIEKQGIAISSFEFGTERVDSRAILTDEQYPIIILNKSLLGDRYRYSLAFELGHLVMHTYRLVPAECDVNLEANQFAAELLMPEEPIRKDFANGISLPILADLKRKWKVSMIALLYRADDLGMLTPNQKRYLIQQFNQARIRRREPVELDVAKETPNLIKQMVVELCNKTKIGLPDIARLLALELDDYLELYS